MKPGSSDGNWLHKIEPLMVKFAEYIQKKQLFWRMC